MDSIVKRMRSNGVLGLNRRNGDYILRMNNRKFFPLVDDKVLCKERLQERGLAVPELIAVASYMQQAARLGELVGQHKEFVIKPAHGSGGDGILVIKDRKSDYFVDSDGNLLTEYAICVDNDGAQALNADLPNGSSDIVVGAAQHDCEHDKLPPVVLQAPTG